MHRRGGGDFQRFDASDGPDNASSRERGNSTQPFHFSLLLIKHPLFFSFPTLLGPTQRLRFEISSISRDG